MSRPLYAHAAALRHQIRRIQRATLLGLAAMLPCAVLMTQTMETGWLMLVVMAMLVGYLFRKAWRVFWAHRAVKQIRLEEQFIRHGPTPEEVQTCLRRYTHLWHHSLTLKGLQMLKKSAPASLMPPETWKEHSRHCYILSFKPLHPSHFPTGLVLIALSGLVWLWVVPEALQQDRVLSVVLGLSLLLLTLLAEIIQMMLSSDLRDGFGHLATLLSTWTLAPAFDNLFAIKPEKSYRHTALYRSWALPQSNEEGATALAAMC